LPHTTGKLMGIGVFESGQSHFGNPLSRMFLTLFFTYRSHLLTKRNILDHSEPGQYTVVLENECRSRNFTPRKIVVHLSRGSGFQLTENTEQRRFSTSGRANNAG